MKKLIVTVATLATMTLSANAQAGGQVRKTDVGVEFIRTTFSDSVGSSTLSGTGLRATHYFTNTIALTGGFHSLSDSVLDASGYDIGMLYNKSWSSDDSWYFSALLGYTSDDISSGLVTSTFSGTKGSFIFSYVPTPNIKAGLEFGAGSLTNSVTSLTTAASVSYSF